ncbi:hypothetical protein EUX98_g6600 [Antrodiella citrinella]|uniref:Rhodanese domain-containing protein n=1 Tax=Antrodiella citrinella TaxID=2447956 RepID=A0A4V3XI57_9APHY|nr:hypothetical protein EUX98_g6600 [Antrodiella citrinella]
MSSSAAAAHRPFNQSPVLIISSSPEFLERASRLLSAKFIGRVSPSDTTFRMSMMPIYTPITASDSLYYDPAPSHLAYIHSLNHTPYDHPAMYDVLRKSATDLVDPLLPPPGSLGIRQLLTVARSKLQRIHPSDAYNALTEADTPWPVLLVDIRPESVRKRDGVVPGAMHVERNVLEWRFDPRGKVTGSVVDGKVITEDDPEGGRLAIADRYV